MNYQARVHQMERDAAAMIVSHDRRFAGRKMDDPEVKAEAHERVTRCLAEVMRDSKEFEIYVVNEEDQELVIDSAKTQEEAEDRCGQLVLEYGHVSVQESVFPNRKVKVSYRPVWRLDRKLPKT